MSWARERRGVRKAEVGKERVGEGKERRGVKSCTRDREARDGKGEKGGKGGGQVQNVWIEKVKQHQ